MHGWGSGSGSVKGTRVRHSPGMAGHSHGDRVWTHRARAGRRQGCEAAGLRGSRAGAGARLGEPQSTAAPRAGDGWVAASPLPTVLPRSLSPGSAVGRGCSSLALSPGSQTSQQQVHRTHSASWATCVPLHLASASFPYHLHALKKDCTPYAKVNVLYTSKFLS